jgi:ribosomal-protein-serine acetyltransferase
MEKQEKNHKAYNAKSSEYQIKISSNITLHSPQVKFAQEVFELIQNNKQYLCRFMDWPQYVSDVQDTVNFIHDASLSHQKNESKTYFIDFNGRIVGVFSFNKIDNGNKTADIGYWLGSQYQGNGIIKKSLDVITYKYANCGLIQRFIIKCMTTNEKSNNVAIRAGFYHQGVLKGAEYVGGVFHDQNIYAKVISDEHECN